MGEILLKQQLPALNKRLFLLTTGLSQPKNKKFVVLLTDARMKEDPSIPSIAETLTTLKKLVLIES